MFVHDSEPRTLNQFDAGSQVVRQGTATDVDVDTECINAIRFLAVDAVNKANSGHPGAPMGQAPIGYLLFAEEMQYNPEDSKWVPRCKGQGTGGLPYIGLMFGRGVCRVAWNPKVQRNAAQ